MATTLEEQAEKRKGKAKSSANGVAAHPVAHPRPERASKTARPRRQRHGPQPFRWTREQYYKMGHWGWFQDKRVELIEGEIYEMSPMNSPHWMAVLLVEQALRRVFGAGYIVASQLPFSPGEGSEPQPDVAIFAGSILDYRETKPTTAVLLVEVSDITLCADRTTKAKLYAQAGIAEYWIVNLKEKQLEVRREPNVERGKYQNVVVLTAEQSVSPLAAPGSQIEVAELLP